MQKLLILDNFVIFIWHYGFMNHLKHLLLSLLLFSLLATQSVLAQSIEFSSPETQVSLIELYTSEGCSSCPPADKWLSTFKDSELLWKSVVPVAFHVEYWDYLGWKDAFAKSDYSQRQYVYQKKAHLSSVYTPGVMKNGREWRAWRFWRSVKSPMNSKPGVLRAVLNEKELNVEFNSLLNSKSAYKLNVALLGVGIKSNVKSGENSGELFTHDFVALDLKQYAHADAVKKGISNNNILTWNLANPLLPSSHEVNALAIWVSANDDPTPVQATGTWINKPTH